METARALAGLRVNERTEARVEMSEKCNEGQLTPDERAEYDAYVQASTLIGTLGTPQAIRSFQKNAGFYELALQD